MWPHNASPLLVANMTRHILSDQTNISCNLQLESTTGKSKQTRMQTIMLVLDKVAVKGRRMGWKGINFSPTFLSDQCGS